MSVETYVLDQLPDDVMESVLAWVPASDLLGSAALVSKRLASIILTDRFWKNLSLSLLPDLSQDSRRLSLHQLQLCCLFVAAFHQKKWKGTNLPFFLRYGSVLVSRHEATELRISGSPFRACLASSTDRVAEIVENILTSPTEEDRFWETQNSRGESMDEPEGLLDLIHEKRRWWSSSSSNTSSSQEVLLFTTRYPNTLVTEVAIKPLRDPYDRTKVYSWKGTCIKAYRLAIGEEALLDERSPKPLSGFPCLVRHQNNSDAEVSDGDRLNQILAGQTPVYESQVYQNSPAPNSNAWHRFSLPMGVVANVVTVQLIGKRTRETPTSGYYACVRQVVVSGIPLYTDLKQELDSEEFNFAQGRSYF